MKLKNAIFEMNPGDRFKWLGTDYVYMDKDKVMREKSGSLLRMSPGNLNVTGEIIPAKPKEQLLDLEIGGKSVKIVVNPDLSLEIDTELPVTIKGDVVLDGDVIPEDQKVLTAEEWTYKQPIIQDPEKNDNWWLNRGRIEGFNGARDNWRLERDLELRGLVEAVKSIKNHVDNLFYPREEIKNLITSLKNLKPLKAE